MKLYILSGPQEIKEHKIDKQSFFIGRQDKQNGWYPDLDLHPDRRASRKHCKIWQERGSYWIKDLQSKHGTLINGSEIKGQENGTLLENGSEIRIGDSVLRFESVSCIHLEHGGLRIDFELLEDVNFALLHCGFPLISNLEIHNTSGFDFAPAEISFLLRGYSIEKNINLPFLKSGEDIGLGDIDVGLDPLRFEGQTETADTEFLVKINGETAFLKRINILAFNEFSLEDQPQQQISLAAFVQPLHPLVHKIVAEMEPLAALKNSQAPGYIRQAAKIVYEGISAGYRLHYEKELSYSPKHRAQKVRLPHQILADIHSNNGSGTCVDLSVLFASCLENAGLKPLLFLVKDGTNCSHAFAGCWQQDAGENVKPLFLDKEEVLNLAYSGRILPVECTGFTQGKECLSFDLSVEKALGMLKANELICALDIYAARKYGGNDGILPLPFVGMPDYSEEAEKVFSKARDFAVACRSKILGTPHLLLGLLELKDGIMQRIFLEQGINPQTACSRIIRGLKDDFPESLEPKPTCHYEEVVKIAAIIARRQGSVFVKEPQLIEALLEVHSEALEKALKVLSVTPRQCLEILYRLAGLKSNFAVSGSFFHDK